MKRVLQKHQSLSDQELKISMRIRGIPAALLRERIVKGARPITWTVERILMGEEPPLTAPATTQQKPAETKH